MSAEEEKRVISILGATGAQGGGTVAALLKDGKFKLRGITRNVDSDKSKALIAQGVEVVKGDVDDVESLKVAFKGSYGLFVVTNYWAHLKTDIEEKQLKNIVTAAKAADVKHVVYSTLEDTRDIVKGFKELDGNYTVPHFDVKGSVNKLFVDSVPTSLLFTTFYYQNFLYFCPPQANEDGTYSIVLPMGDAPLVMVDVRDIGKAATALFNNPDTIGKSNGVAGAELKVSEIANILSEVTGKTITYKNVPWHVYASFGFPGADDVSNMYRYYEEYPNEFTKLRNVEDSKKYISGITSFKDWAIENKDALLEKLN